MIDKIFIPTVNRVDNQITYDNLPGVLKSKVTMVVQAWEREKYDYDCDYLILPDNHEYHFSHYYCISKTRKFIYEAGQDIKYAVLDDDLLFGRRNSKYWTGISSMEKSKRKSTEQDVIDMFEMYSDWLDEENTTICGCGHSENPPGNKAFSRNSSLGSALWINGKDFKDELSELDLTSVKVMEDTYFLLQLLSRGYGNKVSEEFIFFNQSVNKKSIESTIWDQQTFENTLKDHQIVEKAFPGIFTILYDENGERVKGGFRDYGKVRVQWNKAYIKKVESLEHLFV